MSPRTVLITAAAAAFVLVPTAASAYDAPGYTSTVTDASPAAGQPIRFAVAGQPGIAGKPVLLTVTSTPASLPNSAIQIAGTQSATKVAGPAGDVAFSVTLTEPGTYSAEATVDGALVGQLDLAVVTADSATGAGAATSTGTADAAAASGSALAATGFDGAGLAAGAGALVVAGAGAVLVARRRQSVSL